MDSTDLIDLGDIQRGEKYILPHGKKSVAGFIFQWFSLFSLLWLCITVLTYDTSSSLDLRETLLGSN